MTGKSSKKEAYKKEARNEAAKRRLEQKIPRYNVEFSTDKFNEAGRDELIDTLEFVLLKDSSGSGFGGGNKSLGKKPRVGVEFQYQKGDEVKRAIKRIKEYDPDCFIKEYDHTDSLAIAIADALSILKS